MPLHPAGESVVFTFNTLDDPVRAAGRNLKPRCGCFHCLMMMAVHPSCLHIQDFCQYAVWFDRMLWVLYHLGLRRCCRHPSSVMQCPDIGNRRQLRWTCAPGRYRGSAIEAKASLAALSSRRSQWGSTLPTRQRLFAKWIGSMSTPGEGAHQPTPGGVEITFILRGGISSGMPPANSMQRT